MIFAEEDAAMLTEDGEPVTIKGVASVGVFSQKTQLIGEDDSAVVIGESLLTLANIGGQLAYGDLINIRGKGWRVKHLPMISADGIFCRIPLSGPIRTPAFEPSYLRSTLGTLLRTAANVPLVAS
jgi:hypothetical protein